ncbi:uncharacterized protein LOC144288159 [Canis aureus]
MGHKVTQAPLSKTLQQLARDDKKRTLCPLPSVYRGGCVKRSANVRPPEKLPGNGVAHHHDARTLKVTEERLLCGEPKTSCPRPAPVAKGGCYCLVLPANLVSQTPQMYLARSCCGQVQKGCCLCSPLE